MTQSLQHHPTLRSRSSWSRPGLLLSSLLILGACSERREELSWPVEQVGLHRVGYQERSISYAPEEGSEARVLRLALWYPTAAEVGRPANYMGSFPRPEVLDHAPPLAGGAWPVVVFSHGAVSFAEESWFAAEFLASHGFLVAAPDHTGNTLADIAETRSAEIYRLRPRDVSAVLDHLIALEAPDPLAGRAGERVLAMGHSLGAHTALALTGARYALSPADCAAEDTWCHALSEPGRRELSAGVGDPRIRAVVAMAPGDFDAFGPEGVEALEVPVLLMTAAKDQALPPAREGDRYWESLKDGDDRRLDLLRGGHHSFDVVCDVFPAIGAGDGCGAGFLDPVEAQRVIRTYALAFARAHLFDDESVRDLLDGAQNLSEEARLFMK